MVDLDAERRHVEQVVVDLFEADKSRDLARILEFFAEDIVYQVGGFLTLTGKEALRGFADGDVDRLEEVEYGLERTEVSASGDMAYNVGWFKMKNTGMEHYLEFKYTYVLKKITGAWKIIVDAYSLNSMQARAY